MIEISRRNVLGGVISCALMQGAIPARAASLNAHYQITLLYDSILNAGRDFAAAGSANGLRVVPLDGDRIRFAQHVLSHDPVMIVGVTRDVDWLLISDVARERGYASEVTLHSIGNECSDGGCLPKWKRFSELAAASGRNWTDLLAALPVASEHVSRPRDGDARAPDFGLVAGWLLVRGRRSLQSGVLI